MALDKEELLKRKILALLHRYKYGKTAMQAGKTMRRTEGHQETLELIGLFDQYIKDEELQRFFNRHFERFIRNTDSEENLAHWLDSDENAGETFRDSIVGGILARAKEEYKKGYEQGRIDEAKTCMQAQHHDRKIQHYKGYQAGYDTRTLEADHEIEAALKAQATALLEKLPEKTGNVDARSDTFDHDCGFDSAIDEARSIIKEQGGLE